jgi:histidyl-tRNA synthetase
LAKGIIQPRILKGFRDQLPKIAIARSEIVKQVSEMFCAFGFVPIETPALELAEILLGKGSQETDKQMYRFEDNGGRDVALRFDLTIPLARFAAMHINELGTPFRRYHIAPVWRAEKPQRGRFREFVQCDFDIIGTDSIFADAEIILLAQSIFNSLKIKHKIRLNNRLLLNGFLAGINGEEESSAILRAIDKLEKIGQDAVSEELKRETSLTTASIEKLFSYLALSNDIADAKLILKELRSLCKGQSDAEQGIEQVEALFTCIEQSGVSENFGSVSLDLSIARGLDYYTGTVFETFLTELPELGSVCSGGRYDNLASVYSKRELPGVGGSVGLDRLLAGLEELGRIDQRSTTADVLLTVLDESSMSKSVALAQKLRQKGLAVELYPSAAKLGNQLKYADKRGFDRVIIAGAEELDKQSYSLKIMHSGEQKDGLSFEELAEISKKTS